MYAAEAQYIKQLKATGNTGMKQFQTSLATYDSFTSFLWASGLKLEVFVNQNHVVKAGKSRNKGKISRLCIFDSFFRCIEASWGSTVQSISSRTILSNMTSLIEFRVGLVEGAWRYLQYQYAVYSYLY